jgi:tetratricopeptide (TPR) repeat protein
MVNEAKRQAETAKQQAERDQQRTHEALGITDAVTEGLIRKLRLGPAEKDVILAAREDFQRFLSELGEADEARPTAAETQLRIANYDMMLDRDAEAVAGYDRAIRLFERLAADFPEVPDYLKLLARSHSNLGVLFKRMTRLADAEAELRRAVELHELLIAGHPTDPRHRSDLAIALNNLGVVLRERHQAAAPAVYQRAIALGKQLVAESPDRPLYQTDLAAACGNLGNIVRDQGQAEAALNWYDEAIARLAPVVDKGRVASARFFLRNIHWDRAHALGLLGRHAEAIADWQRAFDLDEGADRQRIGLFREIAREEERLRAIAPGANEAASGSRYYTAARLFALAAGAAAPDEEKLSQHYAGRTLALLEQARTAGFFRDPQRIEELKKDKSLLVLGQRPDFQKFVADLERR